MCVCWTVMPTVVVVELFFGHNSTTVQIHRTQRNTEKSFRMSRGVCTLHHVGDICVITVYLVGVCRSCISFLFFFL